MSTMTAMRAPPPLPSTAKAAAGGTRPVAMAAHHQYETVGCTQSMRIQVYHQSETVDCTQALTLNVTHGTRYV